MTDLVPLRSFILAFFMITVLAGCAASVARETTAPPVARAAVSIGTVQLDSDFPDRRVATLNASVAPPTGVGVHLETVAEDREEDAAFAALGLSQATQHHFVRGMLGSSSNNDGILPELYAFGEYRYVSPPDDGYTLGPSLTFRRYRNTAEETALAFSAVRFLGREAGRLWTLEGFGRLTHADPGSRVGFAGGVSAAYGQFDEWSLGVTTELGRSAYDSVEGAGGVTNDYVSFRPYGSIRISDTVELFARLEYYNTELYDSYGASIGLAIRRPLGSASTAVAAP